jgi:MFS family permease
LVISAAPARPATRSTVVFTVLAGVFAAGYGVMFTVLDDFRDSYGVSEGGLGWIVAVGFFSSFAAQATIAPLADRGHARSLLYVGFGLNVVGLLGMAWGSSFTVLMLARIIMGLGVGSAVPAIRRIVICADREHLGRNLGRLLAADVAGFAAGPVISALLVEPFGLASPFLTLVAVSVVCLATVANVHVVESTDIDVQARFAFDLLRNRSFSGAVLLGAGTFVMIGTFDALWAVVMEDFDAPERVASLGVALFAAPFVVLGPRGGVLAQRIGPFRWAAFGLAISVLYLSLYGVVGGWVAMLIVAVVHSLSDGLTITASGVAVGMIVSEHRQAAAQGMLGGAQTLLGGCSALLAGQLYENFGRATAYVGGATAVAVCVGVGSWLAWPTWRLRSADVG